MSKDGYAFTQHNFLYPIRNMVFCKHENNLRQKFGEGNKI